MKAQIAEGLSMAASGYPWWTLDIGGFFVVRDNWQGRGCDCNNDPTPKWFWQGDYEQGIDDLGYRELYVRWLQFGCFLPMFRSHGTDTPREIWNFGKKGEPFYDAIEATIKLRYRLMPYIYSLAGGVWRNNGMMLRPLLFDFPADRRAAATADEFLLGPSLLVCPVTRPMLYGRGNEPLNLAQRWTCYLPKGCDWYDVWTGTRYEGGQEVTVDAPLDRIPLFAKAGAIIPLAEGLQYADQKPERPLEIHVWRGANGAFDLYDDAGDGYGYEQGEYTATHLRWDDGKGILTPQEGFEVRIVG
jgi:alpha-D-xyloside xylohydrolase